MSHFVQLAVEIQAFPLKIVGPCSTQNGSKYMVETSDEKLTLSNRLCELRRQYEMRAK